MHDMDKTDGWHACYWSFNSRACYRFRLASLHGLSLEIVKMLNDEIQEGSYVTYVSI
jgi:hypothetical protein